MRQKRRLRKDKLRLAVNLLDRASTDASQEIRQYLIGPLQTLCRSNVIAQCASCTELTQQITDVLLQILSAIDNAASSDYVNIRLATIEDSVKDVMHYRRRHKAAIVRFWDPFKHDNASIQAIRQRLCAVSSDGEESPAPRDVVIHYDRTMPSMPTPSPRWTKYVRIMSSTIETILNSIPVVAPLSIIPKAVAATAAAFDKCYQNSEAREELNLFVNDVHSVGHFRRLERPLDDFRNVAETMDSQAPYKRVAHATSNEQLLDSANKAISRGLLLENLDHSHQAAQIGRRVDNKLNTISISFLGICFFSVTGARSDEMSFSCSGGKAAPAY